MKNAKNQKNVKEEIEGRKKGYSRSRIYPRYTLEQAIEFIQLIDELGAKDVLQKTVLAELGKKNPNDPVVTGKVSSSKQFGLLETGKHGYSLTERARLLLYPTPDVNEQKILLEAFKSPNLFSELINRFNKRDVPKKATLGNILFNQFSISKNAKNRAANVFIKSAEHANVLADGHLLVPSDEDDGDDKKGTLKESPQNERHSGESELIDFRTPLDSGGSATIIVPKTITDEEIDNVASTLKLFNKPNKNQGEGP